MTTLAGEGAGATNAQLPRLYPIIDAGYFSDLVQLSQFADALLESGVTFLQYRNKDAGAGIQLSHARELRRRSMGRAQFIMNDRADLALAADCDGVHLGQDDLSIAGARAVLGGAKLIGLSTHTLEQVREADTTDADYLAIGPVFATTSKENPDPVVGLDGVRAARAATKKLLVAIGGITAQNAASVIAAGADSVAIISGLLQPPASGADWLDATRKRIEEFCRILR